MRSYRLTFAVTLLATSAFAQAPAGPEFRVNTYTTSLQHRPAVAAAPSGNFVVVWLNAQWDGPGVRSQMVDAAGMPVGAEFRVNADTPGVLGFPEVATDAGGAFTVVWNHAGTFPVTYDVFARRFNSNGTPLTGELRVNTYSTGSQFLPSLASDPDGNFVVVWAGDDGDSFGVFGQRFDAGGNQLGGEFQVNSYTTGGQAENSVAMDGSGNFVVVWASARQYGTVRIVGQRFTAAGARVGGEFEVSASTTGTHTRPVVIAAPGGEFVVAWEAQSAVDVPILARLFDASASPLGPPFAVDPPANSCCPAAAMNAAGDFVISWMDYSASARWDVKARRFHASGAPQGRAFRVNASTTAAQMYPGIAMDGAGNALVAWRSNHATAPFEADIYAQRYGLLAGFALLVDTTAGSGGDGNRVFEPGETVDMKPIWSNNSPLPQTLTATLGGMTGPPGASYAITDDTGGYGTVPPHGASVCVDCYGVAVSAPPVRPTLHWDATARETINPADDAHVDWSLHIGGSFTDVPRTGPFYRYVETLLHHGVTGGCTATQYCPATATTREQMAPFVLLAKEGAGYTPPACTTPVFSDVPSSSSSCRWIEELARRGVVAGCGGGNYCPTAPVTREQMAVFVLRTLDPALNPPACLTPMFGDVPASSPYCRWIEELARRGVVSGCGGGNYCPAAPVTREQMSVFLSVTFGLILYGP